MYNNDVIISQKYHNNETYRVFPILSIVRISSQRRRHFKTNSWEGGPNNEKETSLRHVIANVLRANACEPMGFEHEQQAPPEEARHVRSATGFLLVLKVRTFGNAVSQLHMF